MLCFHRHGGFVSQFYIFDFGLLLPEARGRSYPWSFLRPYLFLCSALLGSSAGPPRGVSMAQVTDLSAGPQTLHRPANDGPRRILYDHCRVSNLYTKSSSAEGGSFRVGRAVRGDCRRRRFAAALAAAVGASLRFQLDRAKAWLPAAEAERSIASCRRLPARPHRRIRPSFHPRSDRPSAPRHPDRDCADCSLSCRTTRPPAARCPL